MKDLAKLADHSLHKDCLDSHQDFKTPMASASGKLTAVKCATCFPGDKDWSCKLKAEGPGHHTFSSNFQWQCPASWPTLNYNHLLL